MALMTTMKAIRSDGTARMPKLCPEKTRTTATQTWNPKNPTGRNKCNVRGIIGIRWFRPFLKRLVIYIYIYTYVYVCMYMYVYVCIYKIILCILCIYFIYDIMYIYIYIHILCVCVYISIYYVYVYTYCVYAYTYYVYAYTYYVRNATIMVLCREVAQEILEMVLSANGGYPKIDICAFEK